MRRSIVPLPIATLVAAAAFVAACYAQPAARVGYIPYEEARPIIEALKDVLPAELRSANSEPSSAIWMKWVAQRDSEIRSRLAQGDEDSLINFLLFGTSFTRNPRITLDALATVAGKAWREAPSSSPDTAAFTKAVNARVDDLVRAMSAPGANERLLFARRVVEHKGQDLKGTASRDGIRNYLLANLTRMLNEQVGYARLLESARLLGDPSAEFAERSKLYIARGLSSDTSLLPNFAIEKALLSIKGRGLFSAGAVRRVAIVGPGLDFTDKEDGYDFYPQQTIQPFAVIDTLLRTGLASASDLRITTLDLSPRVNDHLRRARERARRGEGYTIQLPRAGRRSWKPEAVDYWGRFGEGIGKPVAPVAVPPGLGNLRVRAVRVSPTTVSLITPEDVNIVLQRLNVSVAEAFDLIIATNIFVYYDVFEQSLALANVERMLRPGGLLLSNNALLELPSLGIRSVGYETVVYSDRPDDGDHIVWYQRDVSR
jgi:SAM-dependent methyltransferase